MLVQPETGPMPMRGVRSFLGGMSLSLAACAIAAAQTALRPTILVDGHVATDTILSLAIATSVQSALAELLRGTGVGVAPLFAPATDLPGQTLKGDVSDISTAERIHHADIAVEISASQAQNGIIFLAPTIVLRRSPPIDMAAISGRSIEAIARTIAARIAKDSTRLRRLAEEDRRADTSSTAGRSNWNRSGHPND